MPPARRRRRRPWLAPMALILVSVGARAVDQPPTPANPATAPEARFGAWEAQHEAFVRRAARGDVDLLFVGDSLTAGWLATAPATWARYYAPRRAANFGIGGDHTQHLLWRLDHGELDGLRPRVVVVLAGTNNVPHQTEDQVVEGVAAVVDRVRARLPGAKVLLLGIFPRGTGRDRDRPDTDPDPRVPRVNARLARLDDGRAVRFLDLGPALLDARGRVHRAIQPDFLHLSRKGYQVWADAMEPTLWEMMDEGK